MSNQRHEQNDPCFMPSAGLETSETVLLQVNRALHNTLKDWLHRHRKYHTLHHRLLCLAKAVHAEGSLCDANECRATQMKHKPGVISLLLNRKWCGCNDHAFIVLEQRMDRQFAWKSGKVVTAVKQTVSNRTKKSASSRSYSYSTWTYEQGEDIF